MKVLSRISDRAAKRAALVLGSLGLLLVGAALFVTFGIDRGAQVTTYSMGAYVQQTVYGPDREQALQAGAAAVSELDGLLSWRIQGSDIDRLNKSAGQGEITLDPRTWQVLSDAQAVCQASQGAIDLTIGPVSQLWDFGGDPAVPEEGELAAALERVDYTGLLLGEDCAAALRKEGAVLDLGAVGKGAGCDAALAAYESLDVDRAVVAVGGSVGVYGEKPFGKSWEINLRDPKSAGSLGVLRMKSGVVSTSGSYERNFTQNGVTYHHLLDPATGYPADSGLVSVTVVCENGAQSDALATACFVLGLERSLPLLEEFHAQGLFIDEEDRITVTGGLDFTLTGEGYTLSPLPD